MKICKVHNRPLEECEKELYEMGEYVGWSFGDLVTLDGSFDSEQLEQIAKWLKEHR